MSEENEALRDEELEAATGGQGENDWLAGWQPYKNTGVILHCPKCMGVNLEFYKLASYVKYRCCDCAEEFYEKDAGHTNQGNF